MGIKVLRSSMNREGRLGTDLGYAEDKKKKGWTFNRGWEILGKGSWID